MGRRYKNKKINKCVYSCHLRHWKQLVRHTSTPHTPPGSVRIPFSFEDSFLGYLGLPEQRTRSFFLLLQAGFLQQQKRNAQQRDRIKYRHLVIIIIGIIITIDITITSNTIINIDVIITTDAIITIGIITTIDILSSIDIINQHRYRYR